MSLSEKQIAELQAPLNRSHVKQRTQSGRSLSYIEGWWAIAEANRIFGFDAWTRETVEIKCVSERERTIGQAQKQGWGVTYVAKVRVTVDGIVREGVGSGHGIDVDLGQAHESAAKEAETDAMKRAFMTFGNPFGLALYDKEQANVTDARADPPKANGNGHRTGEGDYWGGPLTKTQFKDAIRLFDTDLNACDDHDTLLALLNAKQTIDLLDQCRRDAPSWWYGKDGSDIEGISSRIDRRKRELAAKEQNTVLGAA